MVISIVIILTVVFKTYTISPIKNLFTDDQLSASMDFD